jgi:trehalose 6-phosphate synthase/phosphatase
LERLANHPDVFIAIVSGRNLQDVKDMVGIDGGQFAIQRADFQQFDI